MFPFLKEEIPRRVMNFPRELQDPGSLEKLPDSQNSPWSRVSNERPLEERKYSSKRDIWKLENGFPYTAFLSSGFMLSETFGNVIAKVSHSFFYT